MSETTPSHFNGKDAIGHVVEAQAQGMIAAVEIHGTELPGSLAAATDTARDTAIVLLLLMVVAPSLVIWQLILFSSGWLIWRFGRSAWLGWSRLERLHRVLSQEKWEIEHNTQQERDELRVLYATKGFEGKLLEDVLDVLMADGDRLLKVMVEEELGLSLESHEHPLQQAFASGVAGVATAVCCIAAWATGGIIGLAVSALIIIGLSSGIAAHQVRNRLAPAVVWTVGLAIFAIGTTHFLLLAFRG